MSRISQEFYCHECVGYFSIRLNISLNHVVHINCPNCGHLHKRAIVDGQIYERGRDNSLPKEEICPPKSSYYKEPKTKKMIQARFFNDRRDGVVISDDVFVKDKETSSMTLISKWLERFGSGYDGAQE